MTTDRSAWVTITAKVFVPEDEITALAKAGFATILRENDTPITSEEDAFDFLAREKINAALPTDDPLKIYEIEIDSKTIK